jgi:hypothetical protein
MPIDIIQVNHVNVTVPAARESAAKHFYGVVLGLQEIPKPEGARQNIGAWYDLGSMQLHLSLEDGVANEMSDRHVCYQVTDIVAAELHFREAGIELLRMVARFVVSHVSSCATPAGTCWR